MPGRGQPVRFTSVFAADVAARFQGRLSAGRWKAVAARGDLEEGTPLGDGRHAGSLLAVGLGTRDSNQYR